MGGLQLLSMQVLQKIEKQCGFANVIADAQQHP